MVCVVVSFLRAGSSVVERSIAARMVTDSIPVSRLLLVSFTAMLGSMLWRIDCVSGTTPTSGCIRFRAITSLEMVLWKHVEVARS